MAIKKFTKCKKCGFTYPSKNPGFDTLFNLSPGATEFALSMIAKIYITNGCGGYYFDHTQHISFPIGEGEMVEKEGAEVGHFHPEIISEFEGALETLSAMGLAKIDKTSDGLKIEILNISKSIH